MQGVDGARNQNWHILQFNVPFKELAPLFLFFFFKEEDTKALFGTVSFHNNSGINHPLLKASGILLQCFKAAELY